MTDPVAVILTYNHPILSQKCIESVLHFTKNIIVVHNGSSKLNIENLQKRFPFIDHQVLLSNRGYAGGANYGLKAGFRKADWVCFITNDCEVAKWPSVKGPPGLYGAHVMWRNSHKTDNLGGRFFSAQGKLVHCKSLEEFKTMDGSKYIPGTAFRMHKEVFEKVGDFDEALWTFWEDVDFSMRASRKNISLEIDPNFLVRHGGGKSTKKDPLYSKFYFQRNRKIVSRRYTKNLIQRMKLESVFIWENFKW